MSFTPLVYVKLDISNMIFSEDKTLFDYSFIYIGAFLVFAINTVNALKIT